MGDISHIMPSIEAQAAGFSGTGHGADYRPADPELAYIIPAKAAAMTLIDLLAEDARMAREILATFEPEMSREGYLQFMRALDVDETWQA